MGIITLDDARAALRFPAGQTVDDADLQGLIDACTGPMEDICGPIVSHDYNEWHDGGDPRVRLLWPPLISVTSVTESYGAGYTRTLTEQPLNGTQFDAFGYTVDLLDGLIIRRAVGIASGFAPGRRNVHVVYTAGRSVIPANIIRATRRLVRWLWQTEMQGMRPPMSGPEAPGMTPMGYAVPNAVIELCAAERRLPGIG